MARNYFKLSDEDKELILQVSTLSGYGQNVVRECYEFLLINWARQLAEKDGKRVSLHVPYIGTVGVRYEGDRIIDTGEMVTDVSGLLAIQPSFKKLIGDVHDEGENVVTEMMKQKIKDAVLTSTATEE